MEIKQKQINSLLLLFLSFSIMVPNITSAENENTEKGKLEIKTDRILENEDASNQELLETELEKTFPDLFKAETSEKIESKQVKDEQATKTMKQEIFHEELPDASPIYEVKSELFTEDYEPTRATAQVDETAEVTNQASSLFMYGSIVVLVGAMVGGILLVARNLGG